MVVYLTVPAVYIPLSDCGILVFVLRSLFYYMYMYRDMVSPSLLGDEEYCRANYFGMVQILE